MAYEYAFLTQNIALREGIEEMPEAQMGEGLSVVLDGVAGSLTRDLAGQPGWVVVSHSTARVGRYLVLTFLLRRDAPAEGQRW